MPIEAIKKVFDINIAINPGKNQDGFIVKTNMLLDRSPRVHKYIHFLHSISAIETFAKKYPN